MFVLNFYKTLTFLSCFLLFFFFLFWEERDIKGRKITYLTIFLTEVDYGILTKLTCSQVGKVLNFKLQVDNLNFYQITGE